MESGKATRRGVEISASDPATDGKRMAQAQQVPDVDSLAYWALRPKPSMQENREQRAKPEQSSRIWLWNDAQRDVAPIGVRAARWVLAAAPRESGRIQTLKTGGLCEVGPVHPETGVLCLWRIHEFVIVISGVTSRYRVGGLSQTHYRAASIVCSKLHVNVLIPRIKVSKYSIRRGTEWGDDPKRQRHDPPIRPRLGLFLRTEPPGILRDVGTGIQSNAPGVMAKVSHDGSERGTPTGAQREALGSWVCES